MNSLLLITAWTLLHFVWQGAAIAAVLALVNILLRHASARIRYTMACAALLLMLGSAVTTFAVLLPHPPVLQSPGVLPAQGSQPAIRAGAQVADSGPSNYLPWLVYFWAAGVAILSARSAGGWMLAQRLKRRNVLPAPDEWQQRVNRLAIRLEMSSAVRLCASALAEVPAVIGWLRPVILVPVSALAGLPAAHLEALLAHELAHVRRHDYLVNLLQTAIETVLFYHPAVWWVGKHIRKERENCCDDLAVSVCGDVLTYARALTRLEQLRTAPRLAMAANAGSLLGRIQRLIQKRDQRHTVSSDWMTPVAVMLSAFSVWAATEIGPSRLRTPHFSFLQVLSQAPASLRVRDAVRIQQVADVTEAVPDDPDDSAPPEPGPIPSPAPGLTQLAQPAPTADPEPPQQPAPPPSPDSDHGGFISGLAAAGYSGLTIDQLIAFKTHGVTPEYARQFQAAGFKPTPDQLVAMRIHGVTGEFAAQAKTAWPNVTIDQLVALRIHGAASSTVGDMRALGYNSVSVDQVLAMQIHGASPEFAKRMKELGLGDPTVDQLLALRIHGVTPEWAGQVKQLGLQGMNLDQLVGLRIHGVNPSTLREIKSLGFSNLSADDAVAIGIHGLTPSDIREAQKHGFKNLSLEQILKLKRFGILPGTNTI